MKWTIGNVEIFQIVEIEAGKILQNILPDANLENVKKIKWLIPNFTNKDGELKALVQSFLIKSNNKYILIDTCNGNNKNRPTLHEWSNLNTKFIEKINQIDISPSDIDYVACTHLHFDHVGWNTTLVNGKWIPTFPKAKYIFSKEEYKYWKSKPKKELIDDFLGIEDSVLPIIDAGLSELVDDTYKFDDQVSFFSTPGHTPSHVSVLIESKGEKALISGDFIYHPCQIEKPEWKNTVDTYPQQAIETRKQILLSLANTKTLLLGSHFPNPVGGYIVTQNGKLMFKT